MKKLSLIALAVLFASGAASATDVSSAFNVTVAFTGGCSVKTAATNLSFSYGAFDTVKTGSTSTVFQCSRGLSPTFRFDDNGGNQTSSAAAAVAGPLTAEGLIQGVRYTLTGTSSKSTTGTAASAGAGGTGGSDGTADEYTVSIGANIAAGQAGTGTGGTTTQTRTLFITY
ncbi:Csu type fimbrial protein [Ramlibacter alkalitolerans]|uniref:Spore coat protein U domain-containing protein n=1 Tax=Ramlibacter alkalitolerans TaxID=2039631 RepID=A0ABS1JMK4_9BURK|nr:hypothetical protein [Ramlibacter alkalitolerans]MBL0425483.1 hypothetical protein [Ramlibacter alkalitolerans]